ncbi:MAG TPA: hypothetical protein VH092_31895 [Urbifossiella sp.]|nr:hypothetical protein [Urbifossiella sp.]
MIWVSVPRRVGVVFLVLLAAALAGCGRGDGRQPVSGTVRIGDEPIRGGFVTIEPASAANGHGRQGRAVIRDGRFDTRAGGEPAVAGPVVIRVQGCGGPTDRFPNGVPVCHAYEIRVDLADGPNELDLKVPESARVKEPKGGWGEAP